MGKIPKEFTGNREEADHFIEKVKGYLHLNYNVPGFTSPMKKMAFTLSLIEGPKVEGWVRDMGTVWSLLDPTTDDIRV
jgi:hypothetical protein